MTFDYMNNDRCRWDWESLLSLNIERMAVQPLG